MKYRLSERHKLLRIIAKMLVPPIMLFGLYVQFHGDYGPGGGFQAGIIFATGIALYGIVFGLDKAKAVFPMGWARALVAGGVLLYAGTGVWSMLRGAQFLNYNVLAHEVAHAQHYGILLVEFGVGMTVAGVIIAIFYSFAGRPPRMSDEDW
ncbi:Na(+)/H(+) antiporter subunit B [Futiania mangrovi]|uniref:Na(+)/H(+) antiporter subunit B n=1 Tax=Futiania mangrovi TaxID=2959716 RepID=A0A9J6PE59_9PROT|nr:Na(+)/H(+) antiporter subunit B [Futiania mangrovii]MCP1336035.1 Na(+)/H(+) antiporter subunit B [Futiania mangrovii]